MQRRLKDEIVVLTSRNYRLALRLLAFNNPKEILQRGSIGIQSPAVLRCEIDLVHRSNQCDIIRQFRIVRRVEVI